MQVESELCPECGSPCFQYDDRNMSLLRGCKWGHVWKSSGKPDGISTFLKIAESIVHEARMKGISDKDISNVIQDFDLALRGIKESV